MASETQPQGPSHWQPMRLGDVLEIKHGYPFEGRFFRDEPSRDVLVTPGNFSIGGGFKSDKLKFYLGPVPEEYALPPGELIVTMTDLSKTGDTLGYPALVPEMPGLRMLHNQRIGRAVQKSGVKSDRRFLFYLLSSPSYRHEVLATATGSTVRHTAPKRIEGFRFRMPPLAEQRAIARVLGSLDDKIAVNKNVSATLTTMSRALFSAWFVDFETPSSTANSSRNESSIGPIPAGWATSALYECATFVNGAAYRDFDFDPDRRGLPIVKIAELKAGIGEQTRFTSKDVGSKYRIDTGDVLFSWSGNPDTSIDTFVWSGGPAWLNQHIFKVITPDRARRIFVLLLLRHLRPVFARIARDKQTTGLGHVTAQDMKRLQVICPPQQTLEAFAKIAEPLVDAVVRREIENRTLVELRNRLLPRLMSGELRLAGAE